MEVGTATITITRRSPTDVKQRQIYISVDGEPFAELLFGQTFTGRVAAGSHRVRANNTLVWKTLEVDLKAGEHARFTVVNRPRTWNLRAAQPPRHRADLSDVRARRAK